MGQIMMNLGIGSDIPLTSEKSKRELMRYQWQMDLQEAISELFRACGFVRRQLRSDGSVIDALVFIWVVMVLMGNWGRGFSQENPWNT